MHISLAKLKSAVVQTIFKDNKDKVTNSDQSHNYKECIIINRTKTPGHSRVGISQLGGVNIP